MTDRWFGSIGICHYQSPQTEVQSRPRSHQRKGLTTPDSVSPEEASARASHLAPVWGSMSVMQRGYLTEPVCLTELVCSMGPVSVAASSIPNRYIHNSPRPSHRLAVELRRACPS